MNFFLSGFTVGVVGDAALQYFINNTKDETTLKKALGPYFKQWGSENALIAAGALTGGVSFLISKIATTPLEFMVASSLVDDVYREYHKYLYPSLEGYYTHFSRDSTRLYNVITIGLVLMGTQFF